MFEQGLEGLRPLQAFALRKVHRSEVSGRRRVRKDLPKLGKSAGDRRRLGENLLLSRLGRGLDYSERRTPRRRNRTEERVGSRPQTNE